MRPDFYFTEDDKIIMDVPVDYESATNKVIPFNIKATNSNDESKVLDMQMTVIDVDEPAEPIISDILDQISVQENTVFVSNFSVKSDSNDTVSMSLSGDDADKFEVSSNNLLAFKTAPNYEAPTDTDSDNVYNVTLIATTGSYSASIDINVTVTNQTEENNPPVLTEVSFNPTSVDVTSESKDVTVSLKVTDASGVTARYTPYFRASNVTVDAIACPVMTLSSGTDKDGVWSTTCTIPAGKVADDYYFSSSEFVDANGVRLTCYTNSGNGDNNCIGVDGSKTYLVVTNDSSESDPPVLTEVSFNPTSVDVTSESKDVTVSLKVTDASGVTARYTPYFRASNVTVDAIACPVMTLSSGTDKDGVWSTTCTIPAGKVADDYYFSSSEFVDANGVRLTCYTNSGNGDNNCIGVDGSKTYLVVTNDSSESDPPVLTEVSFNPTSVDVTSESKDVTVSLKVTDASGVTARYTPYFRASNVTVDAIACPVMTLSSGTDKDGVWSTTCTIPAGKVADDYYFSSSEFVDANGVRLTCYTNSGNGDNNCIGVDGSKTYLVVTNSPSSSNIYYLYGGSDQSDYLGSYGGSNTASDSICNTVGTYGSNVSSSSIWNTVGSYGSTVGTYSPWNSVSSSPPEFFTQDKSSSYGKFTINTAIANRTTVTKLTNIIDYFNNNSSNIAATRDYACSNANTSSIITSLKPSIKISKVNWVD